MGPSYWDDLGPIHLVGLVAQSRTVSLQAGAIPKDSLGLRPLLGSFSSVYSLSLQSDIPSRLPGRPRQSARCRYRWTFHAACQVVPAGQLAAVAVEYS